MEAVTADTAQLGETAEVGKLNGAGTKAVTPEQDGAVPLASRNRAIKRRTRPILGFKTFRRARILLGGIELLAI